MTTIQESVPRPKPDPNTPPQPPPQVDLERIDALIEWAETQRNRARNNLPSEWDQTDWVQFVNSLHRPDAASSLTCGTVCCIAGRVGLEDGVLSRDQPSRTIFPHPESPRHRMHVSEYAAIVLGISHLDPDLLFNGANRIDDLKFARDCYARLENRPTRYHTSGDDDQ